MSNSKISALTSATTPLTGTEVLPVVQSSATTQVSVANLTAGRSVSGSNFVVTSSTIPANGVYLSAANSVGVATNSAIRATFDANTTMLLGATVANLESAYSVALCGSATAGNSGQHTFNGQNGNTVMRINQATADTAARGAIYLYRSGTQVGSITVSSTATNYNTSTTSGLLGVDASTVAIKTASSERIRFDSVGNAQFQTGAVMQYAPAPTGIAAATTLTNAQIQGQIISATGTTYTITMALGTTLETLATWATTNIGYDFFVINTATGIITIAVNTGVTSLGLLTIAAATSAHFRIRRTAANTFVLYRLN